MEKQIKQLIEFLKELYKDKDQNEKAIKATSNIHILDLNLKDLWGYLTNKWGFLDKSALNINSISQDYKRRKEAKSAKTSYDEAVAKQLWDVSVKLTNVDLKTH